MLLGGHLVVGFAVVVGASSPLMTWQIVGASSGGGGMHVLANRYSKDGIRESRWLTKIIHPRHHRSIYGHIFNREVDVLFISLALLPNVPLL